MTIKWQDYLAEKLQDQTFAKAYHELEPEFQVAREVIRLRLKRGWTQKELAERAGTKQSGISRLENASIKPSLAFVQKVAAALGAKIEIHLVARDSEQTS
jgi:transcriptional regulator with XRE-family HTH domain